MQALSLMLVLWLILIVALVIGFAILASPIFAAVVFVVAFGAFLVWRGSRRAKRKDTPSPAVPTTEQASADPARDSGVGAAAK